LVNEISLYYDARSRKHQVRIIITVYTERQASCVEGTHCMAIASQTLLLRSFYFLFLYIFPVPSQ